MERLTWDQTWMLVAEIIARRSKCVKRQVGAVLVSKGNQAQQVGYNGPPAWYAPGQLGYCSRYCPRSSTLARGGPDYGNCVSVHAEVNVLIRASRTGAEGATMYITAMPCWECAKAIANSGVTRVVFPVNMEEDGPRDPDKIVELFLQSGIDYEIWEG